MVLSSIVTMLYNRTKTLFISELKIYTPLLISPNFLYPAIGTHQSNLCFYEFDFFFFRFYIWYHAKYFFLSLAYFTWYNALQVNSCCHKYPSFLRLNNIALCVYVYMYTYHIFFIHSSFMTYSFYFLDYCE